MPLIKAQMSPGSANANENHEVIHPFSPVVCMKREFRNKVSGGHVMKHMSR